MNMIGNKGMFVILYLLFMLPTYVLPYLGSNSAILSGAGVAAGAGLHPLFWVHLAALLVLVAITWCRGSLANKRWLIIFPILAAVFDLFPMLNAIPFGPTVMHLLAIILGVAGTTSAHVAETCQA